MNAIQELARYTFEMFRPPEALTVSEWADRYMVLASESSAERGRWRTSRAPYQKELMDAFTQPGIHEIVIMASSQVGKTAIELNMCGYVIDIDPGPVLMVQPTNDTAEDLSKRRIAPTIAACPTLRRKVSEAKGRDSANTIGMKSFPGGSLTIIGANSPADLASKPIRYIFFDEIDRFPASAGTEGDPLELAERRTETYRDFRKIVKTSTPTIKGHSKIERAYMKGTQEEWHTECPYCHQYSYIRFENIRFDKEEMLNEDGSKDWKVSNVQWECPTCKRTVPEYACKRLPAKWVSKKPEAIENGIRSFRLNAFMSPWSSWSEICLKFLQAGKDPELLKTVVNTMFGESWEVRDSNGLEDALYARREKYLARVPDGVLVLTMGVDTQDNRLEYEVVGWDRDAQSWGIERGVIPGRADKPETWAEIDALLDQEWSMKNGQRLRVSATFIDSGGHFTQEIYRECERRASKRIWPIKGEGGEGKPYCRPMRKDASRGVGFLIGVDAGKEGIMFEAGIKEPGPNYMHFPNDNRSGYDQEYFRGLISERMTIHRRQGQNVIAWEKFYDRNEPLDCRNYARAAYRYFNWHFDQIEKAIKGIQDEPKIETKEAVVARKQKHVISRGIQV